MVLSMLLAISIGSAFAVNYVLQLSNTVTVTVTATNIPVSVTLVSNATSMTDSDHLSLNATVTNSAANGMTVKFYDNGASIGSATIQLIGSTYQADLAVFVPATGTHLYTAGP